MMPLSHAVYLLKTDGPRGAAGARLQLSRLPTEAVGERGTALG